MITDDKPYIPWMPDQLEALVRDMIVRGVEGPKVDRKQILAVGVAAEQVEFAKDISAIANTDDDAYRDHGFLILGVSKVGEICGGITALEPARIDNTRAALVDAIKRYIAPVPKFFAYGFSDPQAGIWGVIVVPPSNQQPHMFIKEFSPRPTPGDWFVRVGEVTAKARPEDFVRVFENATRRAVAPLQEELRELRLEFRNLRSTIPTFAPLVAVSPSVNTQEESAEEELAERSPLATSDMVERELASSTSRIETGLLTESLRLASALHAGDSRIPWRVDSPSKDLLRHTLGNVESAAKELGRTYGALVRFDTAHRHVDAAMRALTPLIEEEYPSAGTAYNPLFVNLRLYPLALLLLSTMTVAVSVRDATLPRALLDLQLILGINRERIEPLPDVLSEMYGASGIFAAAGDQNYRDPIAKRMRDVVPTWVDDLVFGQRPLDCFYIAEFLLYLACLDASVPAVVGNFAVHSEARFVVAFFLRGRPEWVRRLYRTPIETLLASFDDSIRVQMTNSYFMDHGFKGNAALAWEVGTDQSKWLQGSRAPPGSPARGRTASRWAAGRSARCTMRMCPTRGHQERRVTALVEDLRGNGVDARFDRDVHGTPEEGWPRWMESQMADAAHVLVVCTETYLRRYEQREQPGRGQGAIWEGSIIRQELYEAAGKNTKFAAILFDSAAAPYKPQPLRPHTHYIYPQDRTALLRWLTNQPAYVPRALGKVPSLPPDP